MDTISSLTGITSYDELVNGPATQGTEEESPEDTFRTLLVAQVNNMNPLDPESDTDFVAQTAQFNQLDALESIQKSFADFSSAFQSDKALQASALVGRHVLVPGSAGQLTDEEGMYVRTHLPSSTPDLKLSFYNHAGTLINQYNLGSRATGDTNFVWDGLMSNGDPAPNGQYHVTAEAEIDGQIVQVNTSVVGKVDSVVLGPGQQGASLNIAGIGHLTLTDIQEIME